VTCPVVVAVPCITQTEGVKSPNRSTFPIKSNTPSSLSLSQRPSSSSSTVGLGHGESRLYLDILAVAMYSYRAKGGRLLYKVGLLLAAAAARSKFLMVPSMYVLYFVLYMPVASHHVIRTHQSSACCLAPLWVREKRGCNNSRRCRCRGARPLNSLPSLHPLRPSISAINNKTPFSEQQLGTRESGRLLHTRATACMTIDMAADPSQNVHGDVVC
jgi:hypothetical protein